MIHFNYEFHFQLSEERVYSRWAEACCKEEGYDLGEVHFIFCDDAYLLRMNQDYLAHDYLTDIITFDYVEGKMLSGDIFISIERVRENAELYRATFDEELRRVMAHGLLHLMGYKDKSKKDEELMRSKEDEKLKMFHVER